MKHLYTVLILSIGLTGIILLMPYNSAVQEVQSLPQISVEGNSFVDEDGNRVTFQGVSVADPHRLNNIGQWNRRLFQEIADWGANVVRLPIHPLWWRERGEEQYLEWIDEALEWATELEMYLIIDWHSIGNLRTELFFRDIYDTSRRETFEFWRLISGRYAGVNTIAFYEIFNEPTRQEGRLGTMTWEQWTEIVNDIITIIFAHNPDAIPLVAGFNWAYDLTPIRYSPIEFEGIAYVTHPYPQKRAQPWEPQWEEDFGFVADNYPVFATEFGYMREYERGAHVPVIGDEDYAERIITYFREKGISWVAWVFDPQWSPQLIEGWDFTPTRSGNFFRNAMREK